MNSANIAAVVNLLGWSIGFALYAMLLVLAAKSLRPKVETPHGGVRAKRGDDYLPLATALLGLLWNVGALATHGLHELGVRPAHTLFDALLGAASVAALGFLPAVVVHAALDDLTSKLDARRARLLIQIAYLLSSVAAAMHFYQAFIAGESSSDSALRILTCGFVLLMLGLAWLTRREAGWRRAVWATALAVFAVSALHLSTGFHHGTHDLWYAELIGHHASLPLALAVLYQDYRFAFADIFLKRALALLAFVALVAAAFLLYGTLAAALFTTDSVGVIDARAVTALLAVWVATGMLYPRVRQLTHRFVERVVLQRIDYARWRVELTRATQAHEDVATLLDDVCARLAPALTAARISWRETEAVSIAEGTSKLVAANTHAPFAGRLEELVLLPSRVMSAEANDVVNQVAWSGASAIVRVPVTEAPRYEIIIGELAGGRRVLSDDIELLEATAITLARRIDAVRVTHERCVQVQREQEIAKLASEAQLRALRAQINPHFLFNALTTIGYLIQTSPPRALETLLRLTDLLRRVLNASAEWTTLGEELKLIEAYLDIERARFEERLRVSFDVPPELRELLVPSLVVQPVVENAVKHGIARTRAGGEVSISARIADAASRDTDDAARLIIVVRDTGAGSSFEQLIAGKRDGVGLANVEQRLRLCCGEAASLSIETAPGAGALIKLRVPVRRAQVAALSAATNTANNKPIRNAAQTPHAAHGDGEPAARAPHEESVA